MYYTYQPATRQAFIDENAHIPECFIFQMADTRSNSRITDLYLLFFKLDINGGSRLSAAVRCVLQAGPAK